MVRFWHGIRCISELKITSCLIIDGRLMGVAFDWITGNIYVTTFSGYILACDGTVGRNFSRVTVLTGQGYLLETALDPTEG